MGDAMKPPRYTLFYSAKIAEKNGANKARTIEGEEVQYTRIRDNSGLPTPKPIDPPDTIIAGHMNSMGDITYIHPKRIQI